MKHIEPIVLVACSATKTNHKTKAQHLYTSALFKKSRAYALQLTTPTHWAILSALHGLVLPHTTLAPYDWTMDRWVPRERALWAAGVVDVLVNTWGPAPLILLAGRPYTTPLVAHLEGSFQGTELYPVQTPLDGLKLGERLRWLNTQLRPRGLGVNFSS